MKVLVLRCATWMVAPFAVLGVLLLLGSGFGLAFVRTFDIENRTSEPLHVSAIGSIHGGSRVTIPLLVSWIPIMPAIHVSPVEIPAGGRRRFAYDMDDVQITELLILRPGGDARMLVTQSPLSPAGGGYYGLKENALILERLDALPRAIPELRAHAGNKMHVWILRVGLLLCLACIPLEFALLRVVRRAHAATAPPRTSPTAPASRTPR